MSTVPRISLLHMTSLRNRVNITRGCCCRSNRYFMQNVGRRRTINGVLHWLGKQPLLSVAVWLHRSPDGFRMLTRRSDYCTVFWENTEEKGTIRKKQTTTPRNILSWASSSCAWNRLNYKRLFTNPAQQKFILTVVDSITCTEKTYKNNHIAPFYSLWGI